MFKGISSNEDTLIIPVFIPHYGCKNKCSFCNQQVVTEHISESDIEESVADYLRWSKPKEKTVLSFYGGSFTAIPKEKMIYFLEKSKKLIEKGILSSIRCSTRPDAITLEIIEILKKYKVETVELGVQTLSNTLLEKMNRGHLLEATLKALNLLKSANIRTVFQFMTGYPDETEKERTENINIFKQLNPDFIRIYPFVPLSETEITKKIESGISKMKNIEEVISDSAELFLISQEKLIPVIRIGLPLSKDIPKIYPDNLAQVVISEAISKKIKQGEKEFLIPKSWNTSWNIAVKKADLKQLKVLFL